MAVAVRLWNMGSTGKRRSKDQAASPIIRFSDVEITKREHGRMSKLK
jgi:hypothetical protein